jgi:N-acetyl sugar amidotransferase
MPDTKPYLEFDRDGVCTACRAHEEKAGSLRGIDWAARERRFEELILEAKARNAPAYDALVPVSGGKDSITQVHRLLGRGLRILAVNVDYGIKTDIGRYNLDLIPEMGASLMVLRPELRLHRRLIRIGFLDFGDPDLLSHTLLHAAPLHVALGLRIPLVLLGENSAFEYGGDGELATLSRMNRAWFSKYAANGGRDARYVSERYEIPMEQLAMYDFPDELEGSATRTVFSSAYFPWDSEEHFRIAKGYGFKPLDAPREGTYRTYVGIDEKINRIHQYFKVLKFGYGRATDHACEDIRAGRLGREEAKALVRQYDLEPLSEEYADDFCRFVEISRELFDQTLERYRNPDIWRRDTNGRWAIPGHLENTA